MLDGFWRGREPVGNLWIAQPFSQQQEDFELAIGQPIWVRLRGRARATREAARARRAELPPEHLGCWSRPQSLEDAERLPLGRLIAVHERQRLLVGASNRFPGVRRRAPVARYLKRVRGCGFRWRLGQCARAPEPECQLSELPGVIV